MAKIPPGSVTRLLAVERQVDGKSSGVIKNVTAIAAKNLHAFLLNEKKLNTYQKKKALH